MTVNLAKTEFCHATVTFLGHLVGQGHVKPLEAKVNAISEFPVPKCKRQLMQFLGMAGSRVKTRVLPHFRFCHFVRPEIVRPRISPCVSNIPSDAIISDLFKFGIPEMLPSPKRKVRFH